MHKLNELHRCIFRVRMANMLNTNSMNRCVNVNIIFMTTKLSSCHESSNQHKKTVNGFIRQDGIWFFSFSKEHTHVQTSSHLSSVSPSDARWCSIFNCTIIQSNCRSRIFSYSVLTMWVGVDPTKMRFAGSTCSQFSIPRFLFNLCRNQILNSLPLDFRQSHPNGIYFEGVAPLRVHIITSNSFRSTYVRSVGQCGHSLLHCRRKWVEDFHRIFRLKANKQ